MGAPKPSDSDSLRIRRIKTINMVLGTAAVTMELACVLWSTITVNKLHEVCHVKTASLVDLLRIEYELEWIGTNLNFMLGLCLVPVMLVTNAFVTWGPGLGNVSLFSAMSCILFMTSVANQAIAQGGGGYAVFGSNIRSLVVRFTKLLVLRVFQERSVMLVGATVSAVSAVVAAGRHLSKEKLE